MSIKNIKYISLSAGIIAELFLIYIIYLNPNKMTPLYEPKMMMWINAILNGLSAISLTIAYYFIQIKKIKMHIIFIHIALIFSSLFLVNYIFYHMSVGHVRFPESDFRPFYLSILATHLLTSIICLPMIFMTYGLAFKKKLSAHKKIAKWTFALWEYVSVTGVVIVLMLKFMT